MNENRKVIILSGYFDPIHNGHLDMIKNAREIGDFVIVGVNSDAAKKRKNGIGSLIDVDTRVNILSNIKGVARAIKFDDSDGTAIDLLRQVKSMTEFNSFKLIFANGGDRNSDNIPEREYCEDNGIELLDGVGGNTKPNSSSWILKDFINKYQKYEERVWGSFSVLEELENNKIKILRLAPRKSISYQYHNHRKEFWYVISGSGSVMLGNKLADFTSATENKYIKSTDSILIDKMVPHKITNLSETEDLIILEVQIGDVLSEEDIVRSK